MQPIRNFLMGMSMSIAKITRRSSYQDAILLMAFELT